MPTRRAALTLAFVLTFAGCGGGDFEGDELVPLEQVPAPVMEAARKTFPGATFSKAYKARIQGKDAFEVQGKTKDGKVREVEVAADGTVLNVE